MSQAPEAVSGAEPQLNIQTEMSRDLGLGSALAIGVGTMIAAGIFTLSGLAVGYVGSAAIAAFLLAAVVAAFTALTYCEFSSIYPESGEGYLYARRTFPPPLAYLVGWCLLLGYSSSCAFYIASLATYFNEFVYHSRLPILPGLITVLVLTLLNIKGTKESGNFQIVVTVGKVLLLLWFVGGGLMHVDSAAVIERFSTDLVKISSTAVLVFITFFGFSAIAASAGEVRSPTKTIPRAIFISMAVVTLLYTLVVLVVIAADLGEYTESSMGAAATRFLGPVGGMVIVAGALFSMISASNASILAGSRVALSMSQRGHLPQVMGWIHRRTRTPVLALLVVGTAIGVFAAALPLEELAHFADCVLLVALILVNIALIHHRRKFPHLKRPFRVPLVPLLPALGVLANIYLLTRIPHVETLLLGAVAIVFGLVGFLAWKSRQTQEDALPGPPSEVVLEQSLGAAQRYRVLVPIANPASVAQLIDLAAGIARQRGGEIVALRVVLEPEQTAHAHRDTYVEQERGLLELARAHSHGQDVPITSVVRVGRNAARAILETSREHNCNLIVLGWKGYTSTARRILGEVTDDVVRHARHDILLAKLVGELPTRLLLPTAGGEHARAAENYAASIAKFRGGRLTLCAVVSPDDPSERTDSEHQRLAMAKERIAAELGFDNIEIRVLQSRAVSARILEESQNHDAIIVGAAGQSFSSQILFGSIPEDIARRAARSVIMVKRHHPVKALVGRVMSE